ncbi:MAG: hypothetical protein ACLQD8_09235 [Thermoplasmata archaeon]
MASPPPRSAYPYEVSGVVLVFPGVLLIAMGVLVALYQTCGSRTLSGSLCGNPYVAEGAVVAIVGAIALGLGIILMGQKARRGPPSS